MCSSIFRKDLQPIRQWARDTLDLTRREYVEKVQVYKRLDRVWASDDIQKYHRAYSSGGRWDQSNTVLIDDSTLKAAKQPFNLLEIPEYVRQDHEASERKSSVLARVTAYLETLRQWDDVSCYIRSSKFEAETSPSWDWDRKAVVVASPELSPGV